MNNKFINTLSEKLIPFANKLATNRYLSAIQAGLTCTIGLTLMGTLFYIIANPPFMLVMIEGSSVLMFLFGGWINLASTYKEQLMLIYYMTVGLLGLPMAFVMSFQLSKKYKMSPVSSGIVSMIMLLIVAAPATSMILGESNVMALNTTHLGASGLFSAMFVGIVTVEIERFCKVKKLYIKMPDTVPSFLVESFASLVPLLIDIIVLYGLNIVLTTNMGMILPEFIQYILAAPLGAINSLPGMLLLTFVTVLLWCFGVHGSAITSPLIIPILLASITNNAELAQAGQAVVFEPVMLYAAHSLIGGTGNTLAFTMMCMRSKSTQLKAIGRVSIIPDIFRVNEPIMFGAPICFNPILAIPYIGGTMIVTILMYIAAQIGLYAAPSSLMAIAMFPVGFGPVLGSMSITNLFFLIAMFIILGLIWYPFFKVYEKQLIENEKNSNE